MDVEEIPDLETEHVYLLMKKEYRISRNARAQWYFLHLNSIINVPKTDCVENFTGELDIVSAIPQDPPTDWDSDTSHLYRYIITPSTAISFLSHTYRLVFCLDLSPSAATVDVQRGSVLYDEILLSLRRCLEGITRPFVVPGSQLLFQPAIHVTVIAFTPYFIPDGQRVLAEGWLLTPSNLSLFVELIERQLVKREYKVASVTSVVCEQQEAFKAESERLVGGLFEQSNENSIVVPNIPVANPDATFVSMIRHGILALQLLPENSSAGIVVITDGAFSTAEAFTLEKLLIQLRNSTIGCSFVQLGSSFHPFASFGIIPQSDLLEFIASTTFGAFLSSAPELEPNYEHDMNVYHKAFLAWSFQKPLYGAKVPPSRPDKTEWELENPRLLSLPQIRERKKLSEYTLLTPLASVLSCRLREGYTIKQVALVDNDIVEVRLTLPWRPGLYVEYALRAEWPVTRSNVQCEIAIEGPYEFLHDVTCVKQRFKSPYRQAIVTQFWMLYKTLSQSDQFLAHLHSFSSSSLFFTVPEGIKSGVPLFYLPPNASTPTLTGNDAAYSQFVSFWKPIFMLDLTIWQKFLHIHRIGLILEHDRPLPRYVHLPNTSGRYHPVQCRQATAALNSLLRDQSSFVLLENHSYVGFIYGEPERPPTSFYVIRITSKPPCVILRLAFLGGTPGFLRNQIVSELREKIRSLVVSQRSKESDRNANATTGPTPRSEVRCCILLQKPLEKILVRYEKMPADFFRALPQDGLNVTFSPNVSVLASSTFFADTVTTKAGSQFTPLANYLHHRRWVWSVQAGPGVALSLNSVSRILHTLTKIRLKEGFSFTYSASGILSMVLEVQMKGHCGANNVTIDGPESACVLQYVLFPPHHSGALAKENGFEDTSDESETPDSDGQLEIITEIWVEPQTGIVTNSPDCRPFGGLNYLSLAEKFFPLDRECISTLVTVEHLSLMCQNLQVSSPVSVQMDVPTRPSSVLEDVVRNPSVSYIPFCFDILGLLPKCHRAELLFSTFVQGLSYPVEPSSADASNETLFALLFEHIERLTDKEVLLSEEDCQRIPGVVKSRQRNDKRPCPIPNLPDHHGEELAGSPRSGGERSVVESVMSKNADNASSFTKLTESSIPTAAVPKWRCFLKGVSTTHFVLILLPASFQDLKTLMVTPSSLTGSMPSVLRRLASDDLSSTRNEDETHDCCGGTFLDSEDRVSAVWSPEANSRNLSAVPTRTNSLEVNQRPRLSSILKQRQEDAAEEAKRLRTGSLDIVTVERPYSVIKSTVLNRAGSMDSPSKVRLLDSSLPQIEIHPPMGRGLPFAHSSPKKSSSPQGATLEDSDGPRLGSVTLPVYIYDCPLSKFIDVLVNGKVAGSWKQDLYHDHTFKMEDDLGSREMSDRRLSEELPSKQASPEEAGTEKEMLMLEGKFLKDFCDSFELAYSKCLIHALYSSLRTGWPIHSLDVQASMDLCEEGVLEIDISNFIQNICGHLKDFKTKWGVEKIKNESEMVEQENLDSLYESSQNFPVGLLKRHQPCKTLKDLHYLIRQRFQDLLRYSFQPVPSMPDYYFYFPPDLHQSSFQDVSGDEGQHTEDESVLVEFHKDATAASYQATRRQSSRSDPHVSGTSVVESESDVDVIEEEEYEDDEETEVESEPEELASSPLFLHLTASIINRGSHGSRSISSLPTCIGDLMSCLAPPQTVLDLSELRVTLDFLCLTYRAEVPLTRAKYDGTPVAANLRTTSFCSSSSGPQDAVVAVSPELSDEEISISDDDEAGNSGARLQHLPEAQRKAVKKAAEEIQWMLQDEIAAFLLDSFPITELTLETVASHVQNSAVHRASCRKVNVPLQFVLAPEPSFQQFLAEFGNVTVEGYHLRREGDYYYLVMNKPNADKLNHSSLVPPLGKKPWPENRSIAKQLSHTSSENECQPVVVSGAEQQPTEVEPSEAEFKLPLDTSTETSQVDTTKEEFSEEDDARSVSTLKENSSETPKTNTSTKKRSPSDSQSTPGKGASDGSSVMSSLHNTEDGYDGGSSDSGEEGDWLSDLEQCRPSMPCFWLIIKVTPYAVSTFFHCRFAVAEHSELVEWRHIHDTLLSNVRGLRKLVNQRMMLQELNNTRLCDQLLEPESRDDLWGSETHFSARMPSPLHPHNRVHDDDTSSRGYLEATLKLRPGALACPVVWEMHFPLHPRLKTGPGKNNTSRGVIVLKGALNAFEVGNRTNMFVYQEETGSVYYIRLYEGVCMGHPEDFNDGASVSCSMGKHNSDELDGPVMSIVAPARRFSSYIQAEEEDRRIRTGSFGERESLGGETTSLALSYKQARRDDCIVLKVHGVSQPGPAIKVQLMRVLKNKLDDAVLEMLCALLNRNPVCKLTPEDVHFIQAPYEPPKTVVKFMIHAAALAYLQALTYYLRQNLLQFVHVPKYMDNMPDHHFQDYSAIPVPESDVFFYNCAQMTGVAHHGIACIALALVDGQGLPVKHAHCLRPSQSLARDPLPKFEYFELTSTSIYTGKKDSKSPGPIALLEFRMWERGLVNLGALTEKLEAAIVHALWDVVTEYRLLPAPLCEPPSADSVPCSEPSTPVGPVMEDIIADLRSRSVSFGGLPPRITSSVSEDLSGHTKQRHASATQAKENPSSPVNLRQAVCNSTSDPNLTLRWNILRRYSILSPSVNYSSQFRTGAPSSPTELEKSYERSQSFTAGTANTLAAVVSPVASTSPTTQANVNSSLEKWETGDKGVLGDVYKSIMKDWMEHGLKHGVPAVKEHSVDLVDELTIPLVIKAFQKIVTNLDHDTTPRVFVCTNPQDSSSAYLPCPVLPTPLSVGAASSVSYIIIGRNFTQWKESWKEDAVVDSISMKIQKSYQRHMPYSNAAKHLEKETTAPSTASTIPPGTPTSLYATVNLSVDMSLPEGNGPVFIPRQRLLWAELASKRLSVWTYNWSKDSQESLMNQTTELAQWHNARWALLTGVLTQKMGLFHNQACSKRPVNHLPLKGNRYLQSNIELESLVHYQAPPRECSSGSSVTGGATRRSNPQNPPYLDLFRDKHPSKPLHQCPYDMNKDPVAKHGQQLIEVKNQDRKDINHKLYLMWQTQTRGGGSNHHVTEDVLALFRQTARMVHYCYTPLLFLPRWRLQVARTRDPSLAVYGTDLRSEHGRSRHNSDNSIHSAAEVKGNKSSTSPPPSPPRLRRSTDDKWHQTLCTAYLQEFFQYLNWLGFVRLEVKPAATKRGPKSVLKQQRGDTEEKSRRVTLPARPSVASTTLAGWPLSKGEECTYFFQRSPLGGIMVCEVGIREPFFFTKLHILELARLQTKQPEPQFTLSFLDECDRAKTLVHLHSFTYDFHLRSLHGHVSGRQSLFKNGFHLVSFLDDFTKYYSKGPNFARNQVHCGSVAIEDKNTSAYQLYNYLLSHEKLYHLRVLRMVPTLVDDDKDNEYVLVKQWPHRVKFRDSNDTQQHDEFDVSLVIAHDTQCAPPEQNVLHLRFYLILVSRRDFFPKFYQERKPGKFRTVLTAPQQQLLRVPSSEKLVDENPGKSETESETEVDRDKNPDFHKSWNQSDASLKNADIEGSFQGMLMPNSGLDVPHRKESVNSRSEKDALGTSVARSARLSSSLKSHPGIRQEAVNYLGYYSSHEQLMQQLTMEQAAQSEQQIRNIVKMAQVHCRRDYLWQRLQSNPTPIRDTDDPRSSKTLRESKDAALNFVEFKELLELSQLELLDTIDPALTAFLCQPLSWYQGLAQKLLTKYPNTQRHFISADGSVKYVVLLDDQTKDSAMMVSVDLNAGRANVCGLYRNPLAAESEAVSLDGTPNSRILVVQNLAEEFVNLCCFHMWTGLLG